MIQFCGIVGFCLRFICYCLLINVAIYPTRFAISERLELIKQGSSLFMTWVPYKGKYIIFILLSSEDFDV